MVKKSDRTLWKEFIIKGNKKDRLQNESKIMNSCNKKEELSGLILGVDPSLRGSGLTIIDYQKQKAFYIESKTIKLKSNLNMAQCLGSIGMNVNLILDKYNISHVAIEQTIYVQNFQTAQIMGAAMGAVISAVAMRKIQIFEYAPLRIKQAITGNGRASKHQVSKMVASILDKDFGTAFDESDAAAVALCHAFTWRGSQ